ncbi:3-keto-5-aminohexanoate cleavage protein [Planococcus sp. 1R117A]|uniref:3-keto-5-aminohexanoate cleavage protein n=1 Tax=Planococcus sp. 1R117A TaxID=3447020 RepID=UPI003EDCA4C7
MAKRKIIVTVAPTSNFHAKEANPALPVHPDEIAEEVYRCYNAGAAIAHIHARDKKGIQTNDVNVFKEINAQVGAKSNIIQQFSTAPAMIPESTIDDGLGVLDAGAEMLSLDCGLAMAQYKGMDKPTLWTRDWLISAAKEMQKRGIKPELEIFNHAQLEDVVNIFMPLGIIDGPPSFNFVMGMNRMNQGSIDYSIENITHLVRKLPPNALFGAMGIGASQHPATIASLLLGGNVRVGFEDNVFYRKGQLAESNAQLVERIVGVATDLGYEIASPDEAREILGIKKTAVTKG